MKVLSVPYSKNLLKIIFRQFSKWQSSSAWASLDKPTKLRCPLKKRKNQNFLLISPHLSSSFPPNFSSSFPLASPSRSQPFLPFSLSSTPSSTPLPCHAHMQFNIPGTALHRWFMESLVVYLGHRWVTLLPYMVTTTEQCYCICISDYIIRFVTMALKALIAASFLCILPSRKKVNLNIFDWRYTTFPLHTPTYIF